MGSQQSRAIWRNGSALLSYCLMTVSKAEVADSSSAMVVHLFFYIYFLIPFIVLDRA